MCSAPANSKLLTSVRSRPHHSYNVEATIDFVATNGNNVERFYCKISSFRQNRNKLNMFSLFRHCWHQLQPLRALRSGTTTTLYLPHASSDFHRHSFVVSSLATWNNIPASIRDFVTLDTFKTALKTHLFNSVYIPCHWQPFIGASDSLHTTPTK